MKKISNKRVKFFILTLFLTLFSFSSPASADSPDAIAIRTIPNPNHYSALRWYKEKGFSGSPQSLTVDGYEAVRDGRTVYVNAANVVDNQLYTNIYLISYNQNPEGATVDIFGQILSHWKFNSNLNLFGHCNTDTSTICSTDIDCLKKGGFCERNAGSGAIKAEVARDTRRLSDMADIKTALDNYKKKKGRYPALSAGTYVPHYSISAWPSWQETLGKELGLEMPKGTVNDFGKCKENEQENKNYNPETCWNEKEKKFATDLPTLPADSQVFMYWASADGTTYQTCGMMESGLVKDLARGACPGSEQLGYQAETTNHSPVINCGILSGSPGSTFTKYVSASDPDNDNLINWKLDTSLSSWNSWSAAPVMTNTEVKNQKKIFAQKSGTGGEYKFKLSVSDTKGASTNQECQIKINCQPNCAGKACGSSNGCGGICSGGNGTCAGGAICNSSGVCVCQPNCVGKICGDNGCGGSCGSCESGKICENGACKCNPQCDGKACGASDGCGGICTGNQGACSSPQENCNASGICVCTPNCTGKQCGDDGCGGTCGSCLNGQNCGANGICSGSPNCIFNMNFNCILN